MDYKHINPEYLFSVSGGDGETVKEIISMFREQTAEIYQSMLLALDSGDYGSVGLLAHKVKSSCMIMGMTDLAAMLKKMEINATEGKETGSFRQNIERFRAETSQALTELDDLIINRL